MVNIFGTHFNKKRIHFELSILFIEEVLLLAKTLYLMRHGQTLFNFKGLIQGFGDSPLTELGIAQAQKARSYYETKG